MFIMNEISEDPTLSWPFTGIFLPQSVHTLFFLSSVSQAPSTVIMRMTSTVKLVATLTDFLLNSLATALS